MERSTSKRTAFVTGASYGVGAATALALAHDGYDVAISATRVENLEATTAKLEAGGARIVPVALDLRSHSSIERALADVLSALGHLDSLVNNAGANLRKLAVDVTWAEWDAVMATNSDRSSFTRRSAGT
jgi:NAD(P)-dependent dehydrogenase (short-subunit alcohol dehydrogenase family)